MAQDSDASAQPSWHRPARRLRGGYQASASRTIRRRGHPVIHGRDGIVVYV
jgi:hypothetical protein